MVFAGFLLGVACASLYFRVRRPRHAWRSDEVPSVF